MSRTGLRSDCRRRIKGGRKFWRRMDDLRERLRKRERKSVSVRGKMEKMRVEEREERGKREKGKRGRRVCERRK